MLIRACNPDGGAYKYILSGLGNALRAAGHTFVHSSNQVQSDFDIYLGCSGWRQIIPKRRSGLVGIHINPYGPQKVGSVDSGPIIDESQEAIKWVLAQKPDFLYCYCTDKFIDDYYGFWQTKHKIPVIPLPSAADIIIYKPTAPDAQYECDIGWVGGRWPYKAKMLDRYLKPLFKKYNCQIYGWGNSWGNNLSIDDRDVSKLFSTAKICPSISESHTCVHPVDVPERVFKVPASGGFTIHTPSPAIPDLFGDDLPTANNQQDWLDKIAYYMNNDKERLESARRQRMITLQKHTYFDRCIAIAQRMGLSALERSLRVSKQATIETDIS